MRFVVIGSTGYLGSKMVRLLIDGKNEVLCAVRRPGSATGLFGETEVGECLINDLGDVLASSETYDWLLNFVCRYSRNGATDEEVFEVNLNVPQKVFSICYQHGVRNVMTMDTGLPEGLNAYSKSKSVFAGYLKDQCSEDNNLTVLNIELENFYGPDEPNDRFLHAMIDRLRRGEDLRLTEGRQVRDFIHIDDVTSNLIRLIQSDLTGYHDIPLGTGEGVSIRQLMEYLKKIISSDSELLFGAVEMRAGEPDSVADKATMDLYGIDIRFDWKTGMAMLAGVNR